MTDPDRPPLDVESIAVTAGRTDSGGALAPTLWSSSAYEVNSADELRRMATGMRAERFYSRYANPTVGAFE